MNWSDQIIQFLRQLELNESLLPNNILPLYPLKGENNNVIDRIVRQFYQKYYSDDNQRKFIIGINPGRLGAGATGIPFTDTKRIEQFCEIDVPEFHTHEPSSVFIYDMIQAFGGAQSFYSSYYITSVCPVGFVERKPDGKHLNYNYYDSKKLTEAIEPFMISKMEEQIKFGADTSVAYCLGTGKNFKYLNALNKKTNLFGAIIPLEHPRYIMQYKNKSKEAYIDKYLTALTSR